MINKFDYKDDPISYEIEEKSRPDEMIMLNRLGDIANMLLDNLGNAKVLDLCCGTGLSMKRIVRHINIKKIVGVDNCNSYLEHAKEKFNKMPYIDFILEDAIDVSLPKNEWDLIILSSAYHHIEDNRKLLFLTKVSELLSNRGVILVAENILPEYENSNESYKNAVKLFYNEVLKTAKQRNPKLTKDVESLIWRVAQYGFDGDYEYKTSLTVFKDYVNKSKLRISSSEKVWPFEEGLLGSGGNYVITINK